MKRLLSFLVSSVLVLSLQTAAVADTIDELSWAKQLVSRQPELFNDTNYAANVLRLKPDLRDAYLHGSSLEALYDQRYTDGQRAMDLRWAVEHRQMIEQVRAQLPKNLQVAGYDPAYFVGYLNNGFHGIRTSVGYKVFFELRDAIKDLSTATYLQFAEFLSEKGFVGDSKIPLGAGQVRFQYNNVIVHAASLEHALYAEKLGIQFFGNKLAHTGRGIDSYIGDQPQDWHHYLASKRGNINDLSFTTTQYLTFATGASPTSATQTTPAGHTGAQPLNLSTQQKADLAEAQRRADEIITNAKRDAAQYDAQADRIVRDMNGVQAVGRGSNGRGAYSDSAIEAATHDLREQSKYALERGLRESAEVLRLAKLRAGLPTSN